MFRFICWFLAGGLAVGFGPRLVTATGEHWLVTLKDNGLGMDPKKTELIFEPFQRFHSKKIEGTGLGLSICRKIVELHGGKIWVEAEIGLGTQFSFTLSK